MALSVKHDFQSAKADGGDVTQVQPSNWNAEHDLTMATSKVLGRSTAGTGPVEELTATSSAISLLAGATAVGLAVGTAATQADGRTALGLGTLSTASSVGASNLASSVFGGTLVNGILEASVAGNALTIAIKTLAGTDPQASDPVYGIFRNATAATGNFVVRTLTAALSVTISSGSTAGFSSATAGRLWVVLFDDGGTLRLGAINARSGTNIYPLSAWGIASSTAEGGAGGADSAHTFYTTAGVTSKAYVVVGYMTWETGLTTAGTWDAGPTRIHLFDVTTPLPGAEIQSQYNFTGAMSTGATALTKNDNIPQNTAGNEFITHSITPTSAANVLRVDGLVEVTNGSNSDLGAALFQDSTAAALTAMFHIINTDTGGPIPLKHHKVAGTTSSTTFKIRAGAGGGTTTFNGSNGVRVYGGVMNSYLGIQEVMA
jgi:hypothetical protein